MKDADDERARGLFVKKQPSLQEESLFLGERNCKERNDSERFLTHSVKEEFEDVKESFVLSVSPEHTIP